MVGKATVLSAAARLLAALPVTSIILQPHPNSRQEGEEALSCPKPVLLLSAGGAEGSGGHPLEQGLCWDPQDYQQPGHGEQEKQ